MLAYFSISIRTEAMLTLFSVANMLTSVYLVKKAKALLMLLLLINQAYVGVYDISKR